MHVLRQIFSEIGWAAFVIGRKAKIRILVLKRLFVRPQVPKNRDGKILIHLGCGDIASPEFINVDARPAPHVHYVRDVCDLSIFPNDYADLIYACHILEHIPQSKLRSVLWEWKRVLKPSGILRLSVPDFDKLIKIYTSCGNNLSLISKTLMGGQGYRDNFHYSVFNHDYLAAFLRNVGFENINEWDPLIVEHHDFKDYSSYEIVTNGEIYPVSLNIEAVK